MNLIFLSFSSFVFERHGLLIISITALWHILLLINSWMSLPKEFSTSTLKEVTCNCVFIYYYYDHHGWCGWGLLAHKKSSMKDLGER